MESELEPTQELIITEPTLTEPIAPGANMGSEPELSQDNQAQATADNQTNAEQELITEPPNNNNTEILAGGSEFELEDDIQEEPLEEAEADTPGANQEDADGAADTEPEESIEDLEAQQSEEQAEESAIGGGVAAVVEYKINYLVPDDEKLVNVDKIKSAVKRYIDNYQSDAMKKYKQLFKTVYQKYSSKRFIIDNADTEIIVSKASGLGGTSGSKDSRKEKQKREIVFEVSKPGYIFYNKDNNLITMKTLIGNKRQELQMHYQSLVNKLDVQPEEKKQFEKERKQFIDLLERYYIYTLYHHQINNISLDGKANIVVQELRGFLQDNAEKKFTLDGNLYSIDNTLVEQINTHNSNRLNTYNELMIKMQGVRNMSLTSSSKEKTEKTEKTRRDKIIEEIKEYLKSSEENARLNNEIKDAVRTQNTYVDYIVSRVPSN